MYVREQPYHGLGESIGPFEGTFTGTIRGDKDSAATIKIVLSDRDNNVSGQITLGKGLKLALGGFCLMEDIDLSSIMISGLTSPNNPRYLQTSVKVTESPVNTPTVKSADINVTITANLSADGNTIEAQVTFDPLEGVITLVGKVDLKKKGCKAKTLPVTLSKQTPTGSLRGYIYDRPLTAVRLHSGARGLRTEYGALHGSKGGKRPDVALSATQSAEVVRLAEEMTKLAQRNAWTGVERAYKMLESMGDEAFNLIPKDLSSAAAIHQLAAQASWIFGETQLSQTRLLRAKKSLDTVSGPIDDQALRRIIDSLDAIEKAYGAVTIAPRTGPTSKKELKRLQGRGPELLPVVQPFAPDQRRSIEAASKVIKETGVFTGLLPKGGYTLADQSFTVDAGTQLTSKKPIDIRWGK